MGRRRYQHPKVQQTQTKDKTARRWYFKARIDALTDSGHERVQDRFYLGTVGEMNKRDAEKKRDEVLAAAINKPDVVLSSQILFGSVIERWIATAGVSEQTRDTYESIANKHLRPRWGAVRLCDMTPVAVEDWLLEIAAISTESVFVSVRARFVEIWNRAIFWRFTREACPTMGMQKIKRFGKKARAKTLPTIEQWHHFLYLLEEPYRSIVVVCTFTGLRISEVLALTTAQLRAETAAIQETIVQSTGKVGPVKAKHSGRIVPISHLREDLYIPVDSASGDRPYNLGYRNVRVAIKEAAIDAGIDYEGFGAHTFRRMHNTMFRRAAGATADATKLAMGQLGHGDSKTNDIYYVEGAEDVERRALVVAAMRQKVMESIN